MRLMDKGVYSPYGRLHRYRSIMTRLWSPATLRLACSILVAGAAATPAHAYWRGGIWFSAPVAPYYYPPPLYAPPPAVYAPPPVYYPYRAPIRVWVAGHWGPWGWVPPALGVSLRRNANMKLFARVPKQGRRSRPEAHARRIRDALTARYSRPAGVNTAKLRFSRTLLYGQNAQPTSRTASTSFSDNGDQYSFLSSRGVRGQTPPWSALKTVP